MRTNSLKGVCPVTNEVFDLRNFIRGDGNDITITDCSTKCGSCSRLHTFDVIEGVVQNVH